MTQGLPTNSKEVEDRIKVDVSREAPDSNPYLRNHWLLSLVVGFGRRIFDLYRDLIRSEQNTFPDTATGERAQQWGTIYGVTQLSATQASGSVVATGNIGSVIPDETALALGEVIYQTSGSSVISSQQLIISSITSSGSTAVATLPSPHGLSSNVLVTISGADQAGYNVIDSPIIITGKNSFSFLVEGNPTTPATGAISVDFDAASVQVISADFGQNANATADSPLLLQSPVPGLDDTLRADFEGIGGGADSETQSEFKDRYVDRIQNPVAHFNAADIRAQARIVAGVTRVFVEESGATIGSIAISSLTRNSQVATAVTISPHGLEGGASITIAGATQTDYNVTDQAVIIINATTFAYSVLASPLTPATGGPTVTGVIPQGALRVYFMRDNDSEPIPSSSEVSAVRDSIDKIRPANTSPASLGVFAPIPAPSNYTFTILEPNTPTMQLAVIENLRQYYEEQTIVGKGIDQDAYRATIQNTVDTQTGDTVVDFELSEPLGNILGGAGKIPTLGIVTI